jgi:dipeptidyl aminopeptidase/acylaminoacyl peptidase
MEGMRRNWCFRLWGWTLGIGTICVHAADVDLTSADYAAANALLEGNLQGLVRNESVQPHWIGDSGRFWYQRDGNDGPEFVLVTAAGKKSPAFDHPAVARALSAALGDESGAEAPLASLIHAQISDDLTQLTGEIGKRSVECNVKTLQCRVTDTAAPSPELLRSPDGRRAALVRDDNLFVREMDTGVERRLTADGVPFYSWAGFPDNTLNAVVRQKSAAKTPPYETYWSPDGRYLIAPHIDERKVAVYPFVEGSPTDGSQRPIIHDVRLEFNGDRDTVKMEYFLFDLETGRRLPIELPGGYQRGHFNGLVLGWSGARGEALLTAATFGSKSIAIFRLNLATGGVSEVLEESSKTRLETNSRQYNAPNIRVLGDGAEIIWYSDRTGWGHLYLYDALTGRLKNAITRGNWLVLDILAVDEAHRQIYFTAVGREAGRDPYYRHLYRTGLDGHGSIQLLTEPNADHHFEAAPSPTEVQLFGLATPTPLIKPGQKVFVDTWSTVDRPPISALRSTRDGHVIAALERADATRLLAAGWTPPRRERVMAADGKTVLYAVYFAARGHPGVAVDPIIDAAYGGPQINVTPRNFIEAYRGGERSKSALARLGFAVVSIDGRGTPMRSAAFRDAGYPAFTQVGIDDHIAAIRDLARTHREMDLNRAGIYGWSWGGTFAAQAILSRPQFYRVAVSGAGLYDYAATYSGDELQIGPPVYSDGSRYRSAPDETPANWDELDVTRLADRLSGHLLIIYADMDEDALPNQAFRMIEALTRANKPYDLIYLPNRTHRAGANDGYTIKRTWDYFVEHLLGGTPPQDFKVEVRRLAAG